MKLFIRMIALTLGLLESSHSLAQQTWFKTYATPPAPLTAYVVKQTTDGGYLVSMFGRPLLKLDTFGNVLWTKDFLAGQTFAMETTADGGCVLVGTTGGPAGLWVARVAASGSMMWQKSYGDGDEAVAEAVDVSLDGGFIVVGENLSNTQSPTVRNLWVLKLDGGGRIGWERQFDTVEDTFGRAVAALSDGTYVVAAQRLTGGTSAAWNVKLDASGTVLWQKLFAAPAPSYDVPADLDEISGGFVALSVTACCQSSQGTKPWVTELSSAGDPSAGFQIAYDQVADARRIRRTPDQGYVLVGTARLGGGGSDIWLAKLDALGNIQWQKTFSYGPDDFGTSVDLTQDGGYVVAGYNREQPSALDTAILIKTDANGDVAAPCAQVGTWSSAGILAPPTITDTADVATPLKVSTKSKPKKTTDLSVPASNVCPP